MHLFVFDILQFPQLADRVKGEENNIFQNTLEETITVKVGPTMNDTCKLLLKVLDNNREVAELLSNEVHSDVFMSHVPVVKNDLPTDLELDIDDIAIWIDPIGNAIFAIQRCGCRVIGNLKAAYVYHCL